MRERERGSEKMGGSNNTAKEGQSRTYPGGEGHFALFTLIPAEEGLSEGLHRTGS